LAWLGYPAGFKKNLWKLSGTRWRCQS